MSSNAEDAKKQSQARGGALCAASLTLDTEACSTISMLWQHFSSLLARQDQWLPRLALVLAHVTSSFILGLT